MICQLCKRDVQVITKHHLIPKQRGGKKSGFIEVCLSCKDMVHRLFTNKELEREYNTLEKLLSSEKVQRYIKWVRKQKKERVPMKLKKRKLG